MEGNGVKCWIAPRDIPAGSEYGDEIGNAIQQAKVVVLVFSESASLSLWVKGEINTAFDERKTIIPFRIDNTELTKGLKVMLNQFHWIDSTQDMSSALDELLETIESLIGKKTRKGPLMEVTTVAGRLMEECQKPFCDIGAKVILSWHPAISVADNAYKERNGVLNLTQTYFNHLAALCFFLGDSPTKVKLGKRYITFCCKFPKFWKRSLHQVIPLILHILECG